MQQHVLDDRIGPLAVLHDSVEIALQLRPIVEIALLKEVRKMASVLFSPIALRGLTLPNRVVVSPMCQYNSNNGSANDWHLMHLGNMSLGCAGLVMCEMTNVNPQGRISPKCAGMYSDENED